jgi:digeranylgeranylglycerophospholipid reductase
MTDTYDLVVVGAGPAGLMAAKSAGENGLNVALLERKTDISKIHRSCGGVIGTNHYIFGQLAKFHQDQKKFTFPVTGFSLSYDGPFQEIYGYHIYAPNGERIELGDFAELKKDPEKNRKGVSVNKELLLRTILDELQQYNVEVFPNTNVINVRKANASVVVEAEGALFQGTFVIAADGINSRIARNLGFNKTRTFFGTSRDVCWEVEGTDCPDPEGFLFMITPKGFFSMLPLAQKDCYHIYGATYKRDEKPSELLHYLLYDDPTFSQWFKRSSLLSNITACVVNLFTPVEKPFKDNVLLVGDACWRREMSNIPALSSGWMAGKTMALALQEGKANEEGISPFLEWYQKHFYGPHGGREISSGNIMDYLSPEDYNYLVALPEKKLPQTMDITAMFKTIGKTYAGLMGRIAEERPDVMEKLSQIRANAQQDTEKRTRWGFPNL